MSNSLTITSFPIKISPTKYENQILDYWDEHHSFQTSIESKPESYRYVFYDGPPFATGLPHYGHLLASTIKDVIPRYWTMKGYRVDRVWGWDCHGIPIENIIEQELELKGGKKGIEAYGIANFNQACRAAILRFDQQWEQVIRRIGRWVDFKNSYKTMDTTFMESVWWGFKQLYDHDLVYQGRKVILYCPRCATPLSNFEIAMDNSYKETKDPSIFIKFKLTNEPNTYFLAWTTTPWTLIGNVGLAINPTAEYVKVKHGDDFYILASARLEHVFTDPATIVETFSGDQLVDQNYEPLYHFLPLNKQAHFVIAADFVSLEDGTGIVHTAAMYGEDDYQAALKYDLPCIPMLDDQGKFLEFVTPLAGAYYKKSHSWIIEDLTSRNLLFKLEEIEHSVAYCYRCDTQLFYNAVPAWFININKIRANLVQHNQSINWFPEFLKHGRFQKGLETAPDWNISRSRYWGTPMPIWQSSDGSYRVIGSIAELHHWAVDPQAASAVSDLHREHLDDLEVWVDDAKTKKGRRIPEVFDCWVESGSMPFASLHYPFENKTSFEQNFPAQFVSEYIAQTRAWFYTMHVMAVAIFNKPAFQNVVTTGTILAADGAKMSKSKKNFPDPSILLEKYGADSLRFYLMSSPVMRADNLNFSEDQVKEIYQKVINPFLNSFSFLKLNQQTATPIEQSNSQLHILDRWILSRINSTITSTTQALDAYNTPLACRLIQEFIADLSTWYLRLSRDRLRTDSASLSTLTEVIITLSKLTAPLTPFTSELVYQNLSPVETSIHLDAWPQPTSNLINTQLEEFMSQARAIVETLHAARQSAKIPVKQPLSSWGFVTPDPKFLTTNPELVNIINQETNLKNYQTPSSKPSEHHLTQESTSQLNQSNFTVYIDTQLTPELELEGSLRTVTRDVQQLRKQANINYSDPIEVTLPTNYKKIPTDLLSEFTQKTLAKNIKFGTKLSIKPL